MRVTCLNELTEMMHSGYPGRAGRYKLSHIDFDKLEIPGVSDPVHQYIIQNTIKKSAVELATTNFLIGIFPFILVDETYVIDGKNAKELASGADDDGEVEEVVVRRRVKKES